MAEVPPIAIVGAGIAGLTAALALARTGHSVELFERAERLEAVGAGLQLSPNALRVFDRLDLTPKVSRLGIGARSVRLRSGWSGRVLADVPVESDDGTAYLAIHRADLQSVLAQAVVAQGAIRLHFGHELRAVEPRTGGVDLLFETPSGERRYAAPLVIGADGVRSRVAEGLGLPPARDSGLVAARFTGVRSSGIERIEAWLGPKRHAVAYPIGGGETNVVLIAPAASGGGREIVDGFAQWDPSLRALLHDAAFKGVWPLAETERGRPLSHRGRIVLIGDAAHAMLPFAAQGAAMAIEDAYVLAYAIKSAEGSIGDALPMFEAARLERLERVRKRVAFHRFTYHLRAPASLARDAALALRPARALRADLAWLYDWRPPHAAL